VVKAKADLTGTIAFDVRQPFSITWMSSGVLLLLARR